MQTCLESSLWWKRFTTAGEEVGGASIYFTLSAVLSSNGNIPSDIGARAAAELSISTPLEDQFRTKVTIYGVTFHHEEDDY